MCIRDSQIDDAENLIPLTHGERSAAQRGDLIHLLVEVRRDRPALFLHILLDGIRRAFADVGAVRQIHTAHTGLRCKFNELGALR